MLSDENREKLKGHWMAKRRRKKLDEVSFIV